MNTQKLFRFALLLSISSLFLSACDKTQPPPPVETANTAAFLQSLPTWEEFADNPPESEAAPTGEAPVALSQNLDVPLIQDDGSIDTLYNVTYDCQQTPYSISQNPQQIVMYSPDLEILWPGSLIQGRTHKNPIGSLNGLVIAERDSINVSIPNLPTGDNFRRVKPNQAIVASAIGELIGNATADNLSTPSTITFSMESYHSEKQMALSMGISGKYLGFSGSASGSFDRDQSETTVTVQFYQKMFEVVVEPPQTPSAFFSDDFTQAKLQEQIDLGRMGPDNLPVYVSNVVYGRMMMFSLTSTASETEIRAMLNLAYNGIAGNVKADMSAKQKTMLEESSIAITSLGGDAEATIAMIRSGNWKDYFTSTAPLSSASPLSYTFRNLGDGSIAKIVETDEFSISECTEKVGVPGVFDFLPVQSASMSDIGFPVETFKGP
ncbi:MAG: thiol-activated cytolysin family protein [Bacteroidota bacterium]